MSLPCAALQVTACNFLCHPYAKKLIMLTVEVRILLRSFLAMHMPRRMLDRFLCSHMEIVLAPSRVPSRSF